MYIKQNHNKRNTKVLDVLGGPNLVPMFIVLRSEVIFRFVRSVFWVHPGGSEFRQISLKLVYFNL